MLAWLKRRFGRATAPTWRQYYVVYTEGAEPPDWMEGLSRESAIKGAFTSRAEDTGPFVAMPPVRRSESDEDVLAECQGAVELGAEYERDEKTFLEVARSACLLAMRESGYITSVGAFATYEAAKWLEEIDEFSVERLIGIHQVPEDEEAATSWVHSHGMRQFELPELEVRDVPPDLTGAAAGLINGMGEWMLAGEAFGDGHTIESPYDSTLWAVCESVRADLNEGHGEPQYALLRLTDYDPETERRTYGLTRFLRGMASASE
jgi:hypothetical protein